MTVAITSYTGLQSAVAAWLARTGDTDITDRFDDLLALHEQRMYYGADAVPGLIPAFQPLRIREMEQANTTFALTATVAQPTGFLELIEAKVNELTDSPMGVVPEGVLDGYGTQALGGPKLLAVSGTNFRVKDDPGTGVYTATLRYFAKLTTPSASAANWILTNAPGVYLYGCLLEAAIMTGGMDEAKIYGVYYASQVSALCSQRNSELWAAIGTKVRVSGRTP